MKKNHMMRIASVLLVVILLTTCAISATFAKYTSTGKATATATVASWDVKLNNQAFSDTLTFNLFDTAAKDSDGTSAETDVVAGKIAPGTTGSFALTLTNSSEVNAKYTISYTVNDGSFLQFSIDNGTTWTTGAITGATDAALNMNGSATINVLWKWEFGENVVDNENAGKTVTVTANVTASQVD